MKTILFAIPFLMCAVALVPGTPSDPDRALTPAETYRLSMMYESGRGGVPRDTAESLRLLRESAEQGYAPAMNYLGYCYGTARLGLANSPDSALYWIEKAATAPQPDPKAFNNLGAVLLDGSMGIKQDYGKARYWLERGSEAGAPTSKAMLAKIYLQGLGVEPDTALSLPLLQTAAAAGVRDAASELAAIVLPPLMEQAPAQALESALPYYHQRIMPVALPLIERAADADLPLAVAILAQCSAEGLGLPYNYEHAIDLYARAAALGEPHAQFILAEALQSFPDLLADSPELLQTLSESALCADPDESLAATLYRLAALGGVTDAATALAPLRP